MEQKKPVSEKTAYTGRFGESGAGKKSSAPASGKSTRANEAPRRPTGFSAPSQPARSKKPDQKAAPEKKTHKQKKAKKAKEPRPVHEKKNRRGLKIALSLLAVIAILWLVLLLVFGIEKKTVHQLPTIERESIAAFAPEETPLPGSEVS